MRAARWILVHSRHSRAPHRPIQFKPTHLLFTQYQSYAQLSAQCETPTEIPSSPIQPQQNMTSFRINLMNSHYSTRDYFNMFESHIQDTQLQPARHLQVSIGFWNQLIDSVKQSDNLDKESMKHLLASASHCLMSSYCRYLESTHDVRSLSRILSKVHADYKRVLMKMEPKKEEWMIEIEDMKKQGLLEDTESPKQGVLNVDRWRWPVETMVLLSKTLADLEIEEGYVLALNRICPIAPIDSKTASVSEEWLDYIGTEGVAVILKCSLAVGYHAVVNQIMDDYIKKMDTKDALWLYGQCLVGLSRVRDGEGIRRYSIPFQQALKRYSRQDYIQLSLNHQTQLLELVVGGLSAIFKTCRHTIETSMTQFGETRALLDTFIQDCLATSPKDHPLIDCFEMSFIESLLESVESVMIPGLEIDHGYHLTGQFPMPYYFYTTSIKAIDRYHQHYQETLQNLMLRLEQRISSIPSTQGMSRYDQLVKEGLLPLLKLRITMHRDLILYSHRCKEPIFKKLQASDVLHSIQVEFQSQWKQAVDQMKAHGYRPHVDMYTHLIRGMNLLERPVYALIHDQETFDAIRMNISKTRHVLLSEVLDAQIAPSTELFAECFKSVAVPRTLPALSNELCKHTPVDLVQSILNWMQNTPSISRGKQGFQMRHSVSSFTQYISAYLSLQKLEKGSTLFEQVRSGENKERCPDMWRHVLGHLAQFKQGRQLILGQHRYAIKREPWFNCARGESCGDEKYIFSNEPYHPKTLVTSPSSYRSDLECHLYIFLSAVRERNAGVAWETYQVMRNALPHYRLPSLVYENLRWLFEYYKDHQGVERIMLEAQLNAKK